MFIRRLLIPLGVAAVVAVTPGQASATWNTTGVGNAAATAGTLATPSGSTGTPTGTTVPITWTAAIASTVQAQAAYTVTSSPGAKTCLAASTTTGCTVSGLTGSTAYTFSIVATIGTHWTSGSGSAGSATTAATGTATKLRWANCTTGSISNFGKGSSFASGVQMLNGSNVLVADNSVQVNVTLSGSGTGLNTGPTPNSLTVPINSNATSSTTTATSTNAQNNDQFTLTASANGLTSATCTITK